MTDTERAIEILESRKRGAAEAMTDEDLNQEVAREHFDAYSIAISALKANEAAIDECKVCIGGLQKLTRFQGAEAVFLQGQINAYKNILKILEGEE